MMTEHLKRGPFRVGDKVQLTGPKNRINTITLVAGAAFGTHRGDLKHDAIIGQPEGSIVRNQNGVEYLAMRPLLTDFVLSMPRGAAIVYPKDAAQIIVEDDIFRLLDPRTQPPTLYSLAPERTWHVTSISKTLSPGLRVGFAIGQPALERPPDPQAAAAGGGDVGDASLRAGLGRGG